MLIRFLKKEIEGAGVQELKDARFSSPHIPLKEDRSRPQKRSRQEKPKRTPKKSLIWAQRYLVCQAASREVLSSSCAFAFQILSFNGILQTEINSFGEENGGNLRRKIPENSPLTAWEQQSIFRRLLFLSQLDKFINITPNLLEDVMREEFREALRNVGSLFLYG